MEEAIDVTKMQANEAGQITEINGGHGLKKRLEVMGIRVGKQLTKLSGQLMKGPVIVRVGNTQIALGYGMARKIKVITKK